MDTNKKIISALLVGAILVGGYYLFFFDKRTEEEKQPIKQEEISKSDVITKELADKYQATTNWHTDLIYTLQAQERLVTVKPILFRGYVDDIFGRNGKIFIRFSSSYFDSVNYVLELECSQRVVNKIFSQKSDDETYLKFLDEYAIVANIQEVSKPVFALKGSSLSEDDVEINIESSELFTAKGTCVDIAHLEDNARFDDRGA